MSTYESIRADAEMERYVESRSPRAADEACVQCGVALYDNEGTACEICFSRICSQDVVSDIVETVVCGEPAKMPRFRCPACAEDEA